MKKLVAVWAALFLLVSMACSGGGGDGDTTNPTTYSITGQITSNSTGLAGVTVLLSGASTAETTTDSGGNYSFTGHSNGNYTVTPSLSEYTFSPVSTDITVAGANQANIDFTATYTIISGKVSGDVLSDVTITLTGTSSGSTLTDSSGNYSFSGVANGGYTITASKTGYTFSPIFSITVNGANITGQNFTATATFQLSLTTSYAGPINYGTIYVREIFVNVTGTPSLQAVTLNLIRNESGGHLSSSTTFGGKVYYYAGQLKPDSQVIDIIQASIENVKSNDLVVVRNASF